MAQDLTNAGATSEPWGLEAGAVADELATDVRRGLAEEEAAARLARYGPNRLDAKPQEPGWRKFLREFADPLIYLLFAAAAVSVAAWAIEGADGVPFEAIVIVAIVVLNAALAYVQEARAEQAVEALQRMASPTAGVVRNASPLCR